jgi:hypothetical protein
MKLPQLSLLCRTVGQGSRSAKRWSVLRVATSYSVLNGKHSDYSTKPRAAQFVFGGAGQSSRREIVAESQREFTASHRV